MFGSSEVGLRKAIEWWPTTRNRPNKAKPGFDAVKSQSVSQDFKAAVKRFHTAADQGEVDDALAIAEQIDI